MSTTFSISKISPLLILIHQHMSRHGLDRKSLGHLLNSGGNPSKTFRRLDQLLRGERFLPKFIQRVIERLQIPPEQFDVAWEAHVLQEQRRRTDSARRATEETMERRGPHLWGILPKGYHPSLITVLGAEFFLLMRLPKEFAELPHYEMTVEVGEAVRDHYQNHKRCKLIGYEYRRSLDHVFRFDTEGECLRRCSEKFIEPKTSIRIGRQNHKRLSNFEI